MDTLKYKIKGILCVQRCDGMEVVAKLSSPCNCYCDLCIIYDGYIIF